MRVSAWATGRLGAPLKYQRAARSRSEGEEEGESKGYLQELQTHSVHSSSVSSSPPQRHRNSSPSSSTRPPSVHLPRRITRRLIGSASLGGGSVGGGGSSASVSGGAKVSAASADESTADASAQVSRANISTASDASSAAARVSAGRLLLGLVLDEVDLGLAGLRGRGSGDNDLGLLLGLLDQHVDEGLLLVLGSHGDDGSLVGRGRWGLDEDDLVVLLGLSLGNGTGSAELLLLWWGHVDVDVLRMGRVVRDR